jgi:hypothetical protein
MKYYGLLAATVALAGCVNAGVPPVADVAPPMVMDRNSVNPIAIERIVNQAQGQTGVIRVGLLCIPNGTLRAKGNISDGGYVALKETVQHEFDAIGYPVTTSPTELFTTAKNDETRFRLAGRVTDMQSKCLLSACRLR